MIKIFRKHFIPLINILFLLILSVIHSGCEESLEYLLKAVSCGGPNRDDLPPNWNMPYLYNLIGIKYANCRCNSNMALKYYQLALDYEPDNDWALKNIEDLYMFNVKKFLRASRNFFNKITEMMKG